MIFKCIIYCNVYRAKYIPMNNVNFKSMRRYRLSVLVNLMALLLSCIFLVKLLSIVGNRVFKPVWRKSQLAHLFKRVCM